jgi:hypothetical protein
MALLAGRLLIAKIGDIPLGIWTVLFLDIARQRLP